MKKKIASSALIFFFGFFSGLFVLNYIYVEVHSSYLNNLRMQFRANQIISAITATKNKDAVNMLVHRQNVVDTYKNNNFDLFSSESSEYGFWSPFQLLILKNLSGSSDYASGEQIAEGLERGKLAYSLDTLGMNKKAEEEWALASELAGYVNKQDKFKELISRIIISEISSVENKQGTYQE